MHGLRARGTAVHLELHSPEHGRLIHGRTDLEISFRVHAGVTSNYVELTPLCKTLAKIQGKFIKL